jgi:cellulose synthase operon protein C
VLARALPARPSTLVIEDAHPPAGLGLPALPGAWAAPPGAPVEARVLRGDEATPARVRGELAAADFVEIHAHGYVDLGLSEVSLIALSPQPDGAFALTARSIAGLRLPRAPLITLAACEAARTAPYLHEPWSLPYAFLLAGARGVIAPSTPIPNSEAGAFFRALDGALLRGLDPATALRDERLLHRDASATWVDGVVLFD